MSQSPRQRTIRRSTIETLESREVMSADPIGGLLGGAISHHSIVEPEVEQHASVPDLSHHEFQEPDFWLDEMPTLSLEEQLQQIEKSLSSAHQLTGLDNVRADYGFDGTGQTVAVIDSGIAYDHYALGNGLGSNYRVVGGWDFTENDADPYDDGTEGSHGTHVAGIVGADDGDRSGVAPGVDLVGLRVFSDTGAGYFSWVESALQWVHNNRNSFENPITAVNLSLGTSWNSDSIPSWAMLEDEFAQLKADGIFISVSAGNSYTSYNTPGLSYPAASPHVVPVMSSDDSGFLSYFSQRHERGISAPGRYIYSTIPDYAGNNNGQTDDWANFSGTSMAAPYVAGASVLVREAMEFVGYTDITQDTIYDHMIATADSFYDSASGANYNRLNLESAIDALMPEDDFGSSEVDAYNLGSITAGPQSQAAPMTGHIASLGDADYFTFTAGATGTVTFEASNTTHRMNADWQWMGGTGTVSQDGLSCTMDVVAGQQYTIALSSSDGLGYYDLAYSAESTFAFTDWGQIGLQQSQTGLNIGGETYYRIVAGQNGYVTAEGSSQSASLLLLDANLQAVGTGAGARADYLAQSGEELYLRVTGSVADLDIQLTNAVNLSGDTVTATGTAGNDVLAFSVGTTHTLAYNGTSYSFDASSVSLVNLNGNGGSDSLTLNGSSAAEEVTFGPSGTTLSTGGLAVAATGFGTVVANSGGGADVAIFQDTAGNDNFSGLATYSRMTGSGYSYTANGFATTHAYATTGDDRATLRDSAGDDSLSMFADRSIMAGQGFSNTAHGFGVVFAYASEGTDRVVMRDSAGNDLMQTYGDRVTMRGDGFNNMAFGFDLRFGYSSAGNDRVIHYDTTGDDTYEAWSDRTIMRGSGFMNYASGFATNEAYATSGGTDRSILYGTEGDDNFVAWNDRVTLSGTGYSNTATGFETNQAHGYGGSDRAVFYDSPTDDIAFLWHDRVLMRASLFEHYAVGFETTFSFASTGNDRAIFMGSSGSDLFRGWSHQAIMSGAGYLSFTSGFDSTTANASGSDDRAIFYDTAGTETYEARQGTAKYSGAGFTHTTNGFVRSTAFSTGGNDQALLYDDLNDSTLTAAGADAVLESEGYLNEAFGFENVNAYSNNTGQDSAAVSAVDYALSLLGDWA